MRALTALLLASLAACSSPPAQPRGLATQSPDAALVVERFMQAANANDLQTMTALFGTADKTIVELEPAADAQTRMYVLASLLRHDDFSIEGQGIIPGRLHDATVVHVRLTYGRRTVVVPYTVVRRNDGGWIIESIDIEEVTARR